MSLGSLITPDVREVCTGIEGLKPDVQAEDESEDGAKDDSVTMDFEEGSVGRCGDGGYTEEEGYEDEDGVDDGSWRK